MSDMFEARSPKATVRMDYNGVPVEFTIEATETYLIPEQVKGFIDAYLRNGFTPPPRFVSNKGNDTMGMIGEVLKPPTYNAEKKLWSYTAQLSNGKEETTNDFSRTAFRVGDVIRIIKNDRGFKTFEVLDPGSKEVEAFRSGKPSDNPADDIPF